MTGSRTACTSLSHPPGFLAGVVRETAKVIYQLRVCPICNRPQGIARTLKSTS